MIRGRTVILRKPKLDDLPIIFKWRQDAELSRYYDILPINMPLELEQELRNNLSSMNRIDFIIETRKGEAIGMVYLKNISWKDGNVELHTMVGEKEKRHIVFGAEAQFLLLIYAFRQLNMHKIYGRVIDYAKEEEALIKEVGFVKEAVLRRLIYQKGQYRDVYIYGLLDREFEVFLNSAKGRKYLTASQSDPDSCNGLMEK